VSEEQLRDLPTYEQSTAYTPLEKLAIEYAVQMTKTPVEVPEPLFWALRQQLDEPQLIELTAAIAWENYRARFDHALDIGAQGFSEGAFCVLPERRSVS
jgi:alkylhydroperoxidase family enzyme